MFLYCTVVNDLTSCFMSWVVFSCRYFTLFTQFLINCHGIWQSEWRKWRKLKITWLSKVMLSALHHVKGSFYTVCCVFQIIRRHIQSYCGQCFTCGASEHHRVLMWFMSQHTVSSSVCETGAQWSSHIHGSLEKSFEREKHLTVKDKDVFVLMARCTWTAIMLFFNELWLDSHLSQWTPTASENHLLYSALQSPKYGLLIITQ